MNRYRVTIKAWTLVDVDVVAEDRGDAVHAAMTKQPFPPPEGWNSLDFDFKPNDVRDDGPTDVGTAPEDQDLLERLGEDPWGTWDPARDEWDVRPDAEEKEGA